MLHLILNRPSAHGGNTGTQYILSGLAKRLCSFLVISVSFATTATYADSATPRVKQLETYFAHSCALFETGTVSCWGPNGLGGLGDGTLENRSTPVPVLAVNDPNSRLTGVKKLATGSSAQFTCAILLSGNVACWGANDRGQLGNIDTTEVTDDGTQVSTTPVLVRDITGTGYLDGVRQVVTAVNVGCALLQGGRVACWGSNFLGVLGSDDTNEFDSFGTGYSSVPVLVKDPSGSGMLSGVRAISDGGVFHLCAILRNRQVACWGSNTGNQLGAPTEQDFSTTPVIAHPNDPELSAVKQVSVHAATTCVLSVRGTVACWGRNFRGVLGNDSDENSDTPVAVKPIGGGEGRLEGVKTIHSGAGAPCAELRGKRVACWGNNFQGKLGIGTTDIISSGVPVSPLNVEGVGPLRGVQEFASVGAAHSCALLKGNEVVCWGWNFSGELGDGTTEQSSLPVPVIGLQ